MHEMHDPYVGIVIINYKNSKDTEECINSLYKIKYSNYKIILVDNNSNDDIKMIVEKFPNLIFIPLESNVGFGCANNIAIKSTLQHKFDYILLLNNDTIVDKNFLKEMIDFSNKHKKIVCGPKILNYYDRDRLWSAGGRIDRVKGIGANNAIGQYNSTKFNDIHEVSFLSGCCMLIDTEIFNDMIYFSEEYFLYYEDADYCSKLKKNGIKLFYIGTSIIYHKESATSNKRSFLYTYYNTRNRLIFVKNCLAFPFNLISYIYIAFTMLAKVIILSIIGDISKRDAIVNGIFDYLHGVTGKREAT